MRGFFYDGSGDRDVYRAFFNDVTSDDRELADDMTARPPFNLVLQTQLGFWLTAIIPIGITQTMHETAMGLYGFPQVTPTTRSNSYSPIRVKRSYTTSENTDHFLRWFLDIFGDRDDDDDWGMTDIKPPGYKPPALEPVDSILKDVSKELIIL